VKNSTFDDACLRLLQSSPHCYRFPQVHWTPWWARWRFPRWCPGRSRANGYRVQASGRAEPVNLTAWGTDDADPSTPASKHDSALSTLAWGSTHQVHDFSQAAGITWGEFISACVVDTKSNVTPSPTLQTGPPTPVPGQLKPTPRKPATSKLSWASIARCVRFCVDILSMFLIRYVVHKRSPRGPDVIA